MKEWEEAWVQIQPISHIWQNEELMVKKNIKNLIVNAMDFRDVKTIQLSNFMRWKDLKLSNPSIARDFWRCENSSDSSPGEVAIWMSKWEPIHGQRDAMKRSYRSVVQSLFCIFCHCLGYGLNRPTYPDQSWVSMLLSQFEDNSPPGQFPTIQVLVLMSDVSW